MDFEYFFDNAKWIAPDKNNIFPIIKEIFTQNIEVKKAELYIIGYGTFEAYLNGNKIGNDWFMPFNTDYEKRELAPIDEQTSFRTIVSKYDIKNEIKIGENVFSLLLGCGWYTTTFEKDMEYGDIKAVYNIVIEDDNGIHNILSNSNDAYFRESFVKRSELTYGESYDYTEWKDEYLKSSSLEGFSKCIEAKESVSNFELSRCPTDKIQRIIKPKLINKDENGALYDFGINTTGVPCIWFRENEPTTVEVIFGESIKDNTLDRKHIYNQRFIVRNDGKARSTYMRFTWMAGRYALIKGEIENFEFYEIFADVKKNSSFKCNDPILNWLYKSYINSQRTNMHRGIPSDCPHIERRGYTGDGQLCARASMKSFDGYDFYTKWINDISDCQDRISGHVQYTAPYVKCGGGPGGWGSAIVFVPYYFWKIYGDDKFLSSMYPQMLEYFRYLDDHSENNFVVSDKINQWCLGEWCTPNCFDAENPLILPPPFVNNYFYVKSLEKVLEIAKHLSIKKDINKIKKKIDERKKAIMSAYFNPSDDNFLGNKQGANAFALDIGLGNEKTKKNFIEHYRTNPFFDTGIFGTEIIIRLLLKYGENDLALKILTQSKPHGFGAWKKQGATTLFEEWLNPRSMNHPMFGAVINSFYTRILGIKQKTVGYTDIVIMPSNFNQLTYVCGYITNKYGKIKVEYNKSNGVVSFDVSIPKNTKAILKWNEKEYELNVGKNKIEI